MASNEIALVLDDVCCAAGLQFREGEDAFYDTYMPELKELLNKWYVVDPAADNEDGDYVPLANVSDDDDSGEMEVIDDDQVEGHDEEEQD